ncbi:DUF3034 family protein [Sinimarinibacterium sp. CAU 1509]|uniref:DUF3034 family protein n=1 Tax=Sinimarinibacterium sp. CAU 1509 TaxID=2562283 RepID=UPI002009DD6C|nr:DUF3034 family protein [Sinimarinibacterium sp. CAU 1509]
MNSTRRTLQTTAATLLVAGVAFTHAAYAQDDIVAENEVSHPPCALVKTGDSMDFSGCAVGDTVVLYGVHFEFDKSTLTDDAESLLNQVADALIKRPDIKVEIAGHTDSKGSDAYNQSLSEARTVSVMNYLAAHGVASDRMRAVGYGESQPVADNATDEGRALNRRVELRMTEAAPLPTPAPTPVPVAVAPEPPPPVVKSTPVPKSLYNNGKVWLTGGVVTVDGAGGGGAVPWATISGYETRDGINGGVHYTYAPLANYTLHSYGATWGFYDRLELSYTNSVLPVDLNNLSTVALVGTLLGDDAALGTDPWNTEIKMDIYGAKLRLFGDAVYNSQNLIPQVAIGGFYKVNKDKTFVVDTLGASKAKDWEAYVAATKIFFPISTLINVTARYTAANQTGLTGFGSCEGTGNSKTCDDGKEVRLEASIAYLLNKNTAIGGEWQQHGSNLDGRSVNVGGLDLTGLTDLLGIPLTDGLANALTQRKESDWYDLFFAYAPTKNLSFTMAYLMLGNIAVAPGQHGYYLSIHATF